MHNTIEVAAYAKRRVAELLSLTDRSVEGVRIKTLKDDLEFVGAVFTIGAVRVVYDKEKRALRFYDASARLIAAERLTRSA